MPPNSRHQQISSSASIEVHVELIEQLFNSIDPSPFHTRDMDPGAYDYIVDSAKAWPQDVPLALIVHLDRPPTDEAKLGQVGRAIQTHFVAQAATTRLQLKELFGRGRISLLIGLSVFIAVDWAGRGQQHLVVRGKHGPDTASKRLDWWLDRHVESDGDFFCMTGGRSPHAFACSTVWQ